MKAQTLFTAALLCGAPLAIASSGTFSSTDPASVASIATIVGDYDTLAAEYDAATAEFATKLKAADKSERRALRANSPIKTYWPQFMKMSKAGDGLASLWLANHIRDNRDIKSKERGETLLPLYRGIVDKHVEAEWISDAVKSIARNGKYLKASAVDLLDTVIADAKDDNVTAAALYFASTVVAEDDKERAKAYIARIEKEFADTVYGTAARARTAKPEDSEVGKIAPGFAAETIDGFGFKLEDYRGKVVVLDFYGFW